LSRCCLFTPPARSQVAGLTTTQLHKNCDMTHYPRPWIPSATLSFIHVECGLGSEPASQIGKAPGLDPDKAESLGSSSLRRIQASSGFGGVSRQSGVGHCELLHHHRTTESVTPRRTSKSAPDTGECGVIFICQLPPPDRVSEDQGAPSMISKYLELANMLPCGYYVRSVSPSATRRA
jgi:hypothetical protein